MRIFIIEDDDDARSSLVDILELDDHLVSAFSSIQTALADEHYPTVDVVVMDRKLPDGMAEDRLPELRRHAPKANFIIVTGYADMHATIAALREGVSDYLIKPIDPAALQATLARLEQRRQIEEELYRQRRFAEKLLETAEAIILLLDTSGKVVRVNPFFLELTGYELEEIIGVDWFESFIPESDRDVIRDVFERTVNQIKTRGIVNPIVKKDGTLCEIRWSNTTLRDSNNETTAVLSVGLDVTDLVNAQRESLKKARLAAIGETMTGLAHESRNALQRLQNNVELLQDDLADNPQALADLEKIERAGKHISTLLEDVRSYAAPIVLDAKPTSLQEIWKRAWASIHHKTQNRNATLDDSEIVVSDTISGDADRLEQVFRNLFENALDACEDPTVIRIHQYVENEFVHTVVSDSGQGVPETHRNTLFNAFSTSKPKGTGLGLAICQRIVAAHGGTLALLPQREGVGAEFELKLPLLKQQ